MNIVLVVDDERNLRRLLKEALEGEGLEVHAAGDGREGLELAEKLSPDLVLLDLILPDQNGIQVLKRLKRLNPEVTVIIMTAYGEVRSAVEAMKSQAYDYISKPFDVEELKLTVFRALEAVNVKRQYHRLREREEERFHHTQIIGESKSARDLRQVVKRLANSEAHTILLLGESGTGKELVTRALHYGGPRREFPLIEVNCAAIPEALFESEVFGHERGAFTDAKTVKRGLIELAHQGTLFLDEISEMRPGIQVKFLRFLQERRFRRVGGTRDIEVDVRVIAATNRDLKELVAGGEFREDLYYRLNFVPIALPPLRQRREDILPLAKHFLHEANRLFHKQVRGITPDGARRLQQYHWPGNVRELRNVIERLVILADEEEIRAEDLPAEIGEAGPAAPGPPRGFPADPFPQPLAAVEAAYIREVLERVNQNKTKAAEVLGISRQTLRAKLAQFRPSS
jgi:DNA-binding NtrC family response regulator